MRSNTEPDINTAFTWWSELPAKWTPVGWKDHMFRFNILYNGMLLAIPDLNARTERWKGQGLVVGFFPSEKAEFPGWVSQPQDNNSVVQGWMPCDAPVLYSEWARDALVLRQEVFAHIPSGQAVRTGTEPLFAWVRLSISDTVDGLPAPDTYGFNIKLNAPYLIAGGMSIRYNLGYDLERSAYPRELRAETDRYDSARGLRILEPDGKIRTAIAPNQSCCVEVHPSTPTERDFLLFVGIDVRKGSSVDLLIPMLPTEPDVFEKELALGYDGVLEEANRFWSARPHTAAKFSTPEDHINNTIKHNLKLAEIVAERNPETGYYSLLTGSWIYADVWATPGAMHLVMLLDTMGYHSVVEKYLRPFLEEQGRAVPVGEHFRPHPGSLTVPRSLRPIDWTSDHGALLWAIAEHALLTWNQDFIDEVTSVVVKACECIAFWRRIDTHDGIVGLMPPGIATDMPTHIQSVWGDAWNYKGLAAAVKFLRRLNHPRAEEFAVELEDYKSTFGEAIRGATATMPEWNDDAGHKHRLVPLAVWGAQPFEYRNAFYLDTGPLVLVFAGLLDADDELMQSTLKWFREGPPAKVYRYDSDCWQVPSLHHEMSSCEPVYSWNVFHSWQLGDREKFLEGMYSLFAGMVSRQTYTACETRGGITGLIGAMLPTYLARLALVDDQICEGELHLLRLIPLAWLQKDKVTRFENAPTEFGPVSLSAKLANEGRTLEVSFEPQFRVKPKQVVLHIPPVTGLEQVMLNGKILEWDRCKAYLIISKGM